MNVKKTFGHILKLNAAIIISLLLLFSCAMPESEELDDYIGELMESSGIPGLAYGIMQDGEISRTGYLGTADFDKGTKVGPETLFMLASCSKTMTATAVMMLYEQDLIDLDAAAGDYLPFDVVNPHFPDKVITLRHLLTHTSTIIDDWDVLDPLYTWRDGGGDSPISLEQFLSAYLLKGGIYYDEDRNFDKRHFPGTRRTYSNTGFALLGFVVESVSGMGFDEYCERYIFTPLDMNETSWFLKDVDEALLAMPYRVDGDDIQPFGHYGYPTYPDGQIRTSVEEWSRFVSVYLNNGVYNGRRLLKQETIDEVFTIQYPDADKYQAICWHYNEFSPGMVRMYLGELPAHTGGDDGVVTITVLDPDSGSAIIVLMNGLDGNLCSVYSLYWKILKALAAEAGMHK